MAWELPQLYQAEKVLSSVLDWVDVRGEGLQILSNVDIEGVTIEGLEFRLITKKFSPDKNVTAQLEYRLASSRTPGGPLTRIDWKPFHSHDNKSQGPEELRFVIQRGSHHHEFQMNWDHDPQLVRKGNLPLAVPIDPEPNTFFELLDYIGVELNIQNINAIPEPPWEGMLV